MSKKGFESFVNSLITNKLPFKDSKSNKEKALLEKGKVAESTEQGDLGIINMITKQENSSKDVSGNTNRPRGIGLGFEKTIS